MSTTAHEATFALPLVRVPWWKRPLDVLLAAALLLVLAPVFCLVGLAILACMGRPVFFRQTRPGRQGRPFTLLKFRTMTEQRTSSGQLAPDRQRLTPLGRWLRATSLDELPQLFNVLRGDMSLVGPRPLLVEYLPYFTPREQLRHCVRPGITGLAQVHGRNAVSWDERLELDATYVERLSFALDLWILWRTAISVFQAKGVAEDTAAIEGNLAAIRAGRNAPQPAAVAMPAPAGTGEGPTP